MVSQLKYHITNLFDIFRKNRPFFLYYMFEPQLVEDGQFDFLEWHIQNQGWIDSQIVYKEDKVGGTSVCIYLHESKSGLKQKEIGMAKWEKKKDIQKLSTLLDDC